MPTQERPRRLKVLPNGDLELPLAVVKNADGPVTIPDPIVLPEPNMEQLAAIFDAVAEADEVMRAAGGELPVLSATLQAKIDRNNLAALRGDFAAGEALTDVEVAEVDARRTVLRDRQRVAYSKDSPHGLALIKIVGLLTGRTLTIQELPGWAMHAGVCNELVVRYTDPFGGPDEPEPPPPPATPESTP